jgi:hypothetical protein
VNDSVVIECTCAINPITNPNPVLYSHLTRYNILSELLADTSSDVSDDGCEMETLDSKAATSSVSKQLQSHP